MGRLGTAGVGWVYEAWQTWIGMTCETNYSRVRVQWGEVRVVVVMVMVVRTKQHHATALCDETVGQVAQGNARSGYAVDEQDPVAVIRAPFIHSNGAVRRDDIPGTGQRIGGVGKGADVSSVGVDVGDGVLSHGIGIGMLPQQQQRAQRSSSGGGGDSGQGGRCETGGHGWRAWCR